MERGNAMKERSRKRKYFCWIALCDLSEVFRWVNLLIYTNLFELLFVASKCGPNQTKSKRKMTPILGARQEMARWKLPQLACKFGSVILQLNWAHCNWHTNLRISSGRLTRVKRVDFDLAGFADVYRSLFWLQSSHTTARMTVGR